MSDTQTMIVELDKEITNEDDDSIDIHLFDHSNETRMSKIKRRLEPLHPKKNYSPLQIEQGQTQTKEDEQQQQQQPEEDQGVERGKPSSDRWWVWYGYIRYMYLIGMIVLFVILTVMVVWLLYIWSNQVTLHALVCEDPSSLSSTGTTGMG